MTNEREDDHLEPSPADRVGRAFEDMAKTGTSIAGRNVRLWNQVSANLRNKKYTADDMAGDTAATFAAAMDNASDLWTLVTNPPERETVASPVPAAVLFFPREGDRWALPDPVWIRMPPVGDGERPPKEAQIQWANPNALAVQALALAVRTTLGSSRRAYRVEVSGYAGLVEGVFTGFVYVVMNGQVRPLATLRAIVEGDQSRDQGKAPEGAESQGE